MIAQLSKHINTKIIMNTNQIILCLGLILCLVSCTDKGKFNLTGKIDNGKDQTLYLQELQLADMVTVDSVKLKEKGTFKFSLPKLEQPTFFLLKLSENNFVTLLADTSEQVEVLGNADNLAASYNVKNSLGSSYVKVLNTKFDKTKAIVDSLITQYNAIPKSDTQEAQKVRENLIHTIDKQKDFVRDFVMANPRSFASYYALFQRFDDGNLVLNAYDKTDLNLFATVATSLDLFYPESSRSKQLKNFVLSVKKEKRMEEIQEKLANSAQQSMPDVEEKDLNGKMVKLSSLRGKTVLLSFWASWDEASRKENMELLKVYRKHKSRGFEIYQVSLDRSKILWEGAVESDKLPWINVSDLKYTDSYPARVFNVKKLPANYLISKEGEIIGKDLFGRILDEKLNDLLNK